MYNLTYKTEQQKQQAAQQKQIAENLFKVFAPLSGNGQKPVPTHNDSKK
jgi:hypothetical protein